MGAPACFLLVPTCCIVELTFFSFELQCTLSFPMGHTALTLTDKVGCTSSDPDGSEDSNGVSVFQIGCKIIMEAQVKSV